MAVRSGSWTTLHRCGSSADNLPREDLILYQPQTAVRLHYPEEFDKRQPVSNNPPPGAIINYYFKTAQKDEVSLDILDASGKVVRHLSSKEKKKANNRLNGQTGSSEQKQFRQTRG